MSTLDPYSLGKMSFAELKSMARDMDLSSKRSKAEYITIITASFDEYERYKKKKIDKYKRGKQLGLKGKEGTTYIVTDISTGKEFAMKTFRKTKSSDTLRAEYEFQKAASNFGIAPRVVEYDTVGKYIVMEKMDSHLVDIIKTQSDIVTKDQQLQIIDIFTKLDGCGIFHGDSNILNFMTKGDKIYIIDFGFAKNIDSRVIKKMGTKPNVKVCLLAFILKLREMKCHISSWKYLKRHLDTDDMEKFSI
jgi:tRNA A-37 threonylcarbamoyl transferase component Bud32